MTTQTINQEILKEYYTALWSLQNNFMSTALKEFAFKYPSEFKTISAMARKRKQLNRDIFAMEQYTQRICWFTLTFDVVKDRNLETSKRKEAFNFLNDIFALFVIAEELGEEKGRYHIHGFGALKDNKNITDFYKWHSREDIFLIENKHYRQQKIKYLTNYAIKEIPRLRRNKRLTKLRKETDKALTMKSNFPNYSKQICEEAVFKVDLDLISDNM